MRALRIVLGLVGTLAALAVLSVPALLVALNTEAGRRAAEAAVARATGGAVVVSGLGGTFPAAPALGRLELRDGGGVWLVVEDASLDWSPLALLRGEARIGRLGAGRVVVARLPARSGAADGSGGGLPVRVALERLDIGQLELGPAVAGAAAVLRVEGSARLESLEAGEGKLALERLDRPGRYRLEGAVGGVDLRSAVELREPAGGLVAEIAGLPAVGAIEATGSLAGTWNAAALRLGVAAGPLRAAASGTLDLKSRAGEVEVTASAPAMRPRPDVAWQGVSLEARVHGPLAAPEGSGSLRLDGLEAAGAGLRRLEARFSGNTGAATLEATAEGLSLPGPNPDLLAGAPLALSARMVPGAPGRPVSFSLVHPLVRVTGSLRTEGTRTGEADVGLPDLGPLAALGGLDLKGSAALKARVADGAEGLHLDLDGTVGVSGGEEPVPALLGPDASLGAGVTVKGDAVALSRLAVNGRALTLEAKGGLAGGEVALDWRVGLNDLHALAATVAGRLEATGRLSGRPGALEARADVTAELGAGGFAPAPVRASLRATGLPASPAGTVEAEGELAGAPLTLAAEATRAADGALHVRIARAGWRSLAAEGTLDLPAGATLPLGTMTLRAGDLGDLSQLLGHPLAGRVEASLTTEQQQGVPVAVLAATARGVGLPGQAIAGEAKLGARVRDPAGEAALEAQLDVGGLNAGTVGGGARLTAAGRPDALALGLTADLTGVAGAPLAVRAAAVADAAGRSLRVNTLEAGWKGASLRLAAPARLDFAAGLAVDRLRLGLGEVTLEVAGRISPALELSATLRNLTADTVRLLVPGLPAEGRVAAEARLTGTTGRPEGTLRVEASGLGVKGAAGLPAGTLAARATLAGGAGRLDATLSAGRNRIALAGTAPLGAGPLDLRATGTLDLATLDPLLTPNGRQARGLVTLDGSIGGTLAAPRAGGSLRLAGGSVRDFAHGARLDGVEAEIEGSGDALRITRLTARAGKGTISASGTIGLAPPMPVAFSLSARDASPLASDRLTAVLGADLTLAGELAGRMNLGGTVRISQAEIRIPEKLPAEVAVLVVRRPGQKPPPAPAPPPDIGLDLTLVSPGQLYVRGRGLNAELGGELHLGGTLAAPQPGGGFSLRRGQFNLAGGALDFSRGRVAFDGSGGIDPSLDFLASSRNAGVVASLAVTGYASQPRFTLSSVPELPQDQVLAWLLFHRSVATLSPLQAAQIAQALAQLAGVGGGFDPLERLRGGLGLDRLSVSGGEGGKGAAVEAGRTIAPGVYVGARQSTGGAGGGGTQGVVQVDIAKGLKLEATVGQSQSATGAAQTTQDQGTSVGVTYEFEY